MTATPDVSPRQRLKALMVEANYGSSAIAVIAAAAIPSYELGQVLDDEYVGYVCTAVEVIAACRYSGAALDSIVESYRRKYGPTWRVEFWRRCLRLAQRRSVVAANSPAA